MLSDRNSGHLLLNVHSKKAFDKSAVNSIIGSLLKYFSYGFDVRSFYPGDGRGRESLT